MLNLTCAPPGPPIEEKVKIVFLSCPCPLELVSLLEENEAVKDASRIEHITHLKILKMSPLAHILMLNNCLTHVVVS